VTLRVGAKPGAPLPLATAGKIVGVADDAARVQALVTETGGATHRPDGSTCPVTCSLADGRWSLESNGVIRRGWTRLREPRRIRLELKAFR
jgi:hypothetical protein